MYLFPRDLYLPAGELPGDLTDESAHVMEYQAEGLTSTAAAVPGAAHEAEETAKLIVAHHRAARPSCSAEVHGTHQCSSKTFSSSTRSLFVKCCLFQLSITGALFGTPSTPRSSRPRQYRQSYNARKWPYPDTHETHGGVTASMKMPNCRLFVYVCSAPFLF